MLDVKEIYGPTSLYCLYPMHITAISKLTVTFRENSFRPQQISTPKDAFHYQTHIRAENVDSAHSSGSREPGKVLGGRGLAGSCFVYSLCSE